MTDEQIKMLQQMLNKLGFTVAKTSYGSSGQETNYFGPLTYQALTKFQEAHRQKVLTPVGLTRGSGFFGPYSMKRMNEIIGGSN